MSDPTPEQGVHEMRDTWVARTPEGDREITLVVGFDGPADSDQGHQCQRPDLEAIVCDLAEAGPLYDMEFGDCPLCDKVSTSDPVNPEDHAESCPWRRAVEWVRDTDQETT